MIALPARNRQGGVALITAIVLVALATVLAVSIAFSSAMTARRGAAVFSVEQGLMFAQGAEALAAYVLVDDYKQGGAKKQDTLSERWTEPYGPVEIAPEIALAAQLSDEQGKFNLNGLLNQNGVADPERVAEFERLLRFVELEPRWAALLADWIDADPQGSAYNSDGGEDSLYAGQDPPYRTLNMPVTSVSELLQLPGFGRERFLKLAPYVTALPRGELLNVCTAPEFVLDALSEDTQQWDSKSLAENRKSGCFPTKDQVVNGLQTATEKTRVGTQIAESSNYFRLASWVSVGTTQFALYSLMYRDPQGQVRPILRNYGAD